MAQDLSIEAGNGWDWQREIGGDRYAAARACPHIDTSPAGMAWHLGRSLAASGNARPSIRASGTHVLTSRGDTFRVVQYEDGKAINDTATFLKWQPDNTFSVAHK